jgi:hypothetical protein
VYPSAFDVVAPNSTVQTKQTAINISFELALFIVLPFFNERQRLESCLLPRA